MSDTGVTTWGKYLKSDKAQEKPEREPVVGVTTMGAYLESKGADGEKQVDADDEVEDKAVAKKAASKKGD